MEVPAIRPTSEPARDSARQKEPATNVPLQKGTLLKFPPDSTSGVIAGASEDRRFREAAFDRDVVLRVKARYFGGISAVDTVFVTKVAGG